MVTDTLLTALNILLNPLTIATLSVVIIGVITYIAKRRK